MGESVSQRRMIMVRSFFFLTYEECDSDIHTPTLSKSTRVTMISTVLPNSIYTTVICHLRCDPRTPKSHGKRGPGARNIYEPQIVTDAPRTWSIEWMFQERIGCELSTNFNVHRDISKRNQNVTVWET